MQRPFAREAEGVAPHGALPRLRGRRGRHPWSVASLARPKGSPPVERCLACEAEGVATRGALPRLRGRRGRHPWSVASLARPKGSPPVERCLACEAVVSRETSRYPRRPFLGSVSRLFWIATHLQELRPAIVSSFLVANDRACQGKGHHMIAPPLTTASQARQRSTASPLFSKPATPRFECRLKRIGAVGRGTFDSKKQA